MEWPHHKGEKSCEAQLALYDHVTTIAYAPSRPQGNRFVKSEND
jgi:hypothetical protein